MSQPPFVLEPVDILVGIDGSENSEQALAVAVSIATEHGSSLRLVSAFSVPTIPQRHAAQISDAHYQGVAAATQDLLNAHLAQIEGAGIRAVAQAIEGDASGVLIEASRFARLVVVGKRGRNRLASRMLGTVSERLVAHSHAPVLVVPHQDGSADRSEALAQREADDQGPTAHTDPGRFRHGVVAGIDVGPTALPVAAAAARAARGCAGRLTLMTAVPSASRAGLAGLVQPSAADRAAARSAHAQNLEEVAAGITERHPGLAVDLRLVEGAASQVLSEAARNAALTVVGTRGRGGFASLLLGSVTRSVLNEAERPVLVIPTQHDR